MRTQRFEFSSHGNRLVGFLDTPATQDARALIAIIHGYGATNVAETTTYYDLRTRFTALGVATLLWDKPGCGESEGTFDANQPVTESAREVLDALSQARADNIAGTSKTGLWGISRAGWIAPIAMTQDPSIAFWISVSGVDDQESFPYFLESNLRIEGRSEAEITALLAEWRRGFAITRAGGSYADYLAATEHLRREPFMLALGFNPSEAAFIADQQSFLSGSAQVDPASGLMIYVPNFAAMLSQIDAPVLALFGERDRNVNWRKTKALYERTIGANPRARLTVRIFPDGDHNIRQSTTGGLGEMMQNNGPASAGYYDAMEDWLRQEVLR